MGFGHKDLNFGKDDFVEVAHLKFQPFGNPINKQEDEPVMIENWPLGKEQWLRLRPPGLPFHCILYF